LLGVCSNKNSSNYLLVCDFGGNVIEEDALTKKTIELLEDFHARRLAKLEGIKLAHLLKKNPYLYRSIGHSAAADYIKATLDALVSSSDETIFGNVFFEPLAKWAAQQAYAGNDGVTVQVGGGAGFDVSIETPTDYKAIAVKSGVNIFNSQSDKQQKTELDALQARIRKEKKVFYPIIGYGYGRKEQREKNPKVLKLAGQAFWAEITGDENFYQRISLALGDKPMRLSTDFEKAYTQARNRLEKAFMDDYVDVDGNIAWASLIAFSSACKKPKQERKPSVNRPGRRRRLAAAENPA
jgi:hypothetical protein